MCFIVVIGHIDEISNIRQLQIPRDFFALEPTSTVYSDVACTLIVFNFGKKDLVSCDYGTIYKVFSANICSEQHP
jgi:hypothetical protein